MTVKNSSYSASKLVLLFWIIFPFLSFVNTLNTGKYNGDFLTVKTHLTNWELFYVLVFNIIPFLILFLVYKYYKNRNSKYQIKIPLKAFGIFLLFLTLFQILISIFYGVSVMKWQVQYHGQAPGIIHLFIIVFNRFDPILGVFIYFVCENKKNKLKYILLFLLIVRSLVRYSISIFVFLFLLFLLQNYNAIILFIKRKFLISVLVSCFLISFSPNLVMYIVNQRNKGRNGVELLEKMDIPMIVFGIMAGRMSSFSESAVITEWKPKVKALIKPKPEYEYIKEAMEFFNAKQHRLNETRYNKILLNSQGMYDRHVGFMTSTYGALLIGSYKSYIALIVNFLTILMCVLGGFKIIGLLHYDRVKEIVFT